MFVFRESLVWPKLYILICCVVYSISYIETLKYDKIYIRYMDNTTISDAVSSD